jgi:hypothetical protein
MPTASARGRRTSRRHDAASLDSARAACCPPQSAGVARSLASTLTFPAGTQITKLNGQAIFTVSRQLRHRLAEQRQPRRQRHRQAVGRVRRDHVQRDTRLCRPRGRDRHTGRRRDFRGTMRRTSKGPGLRQTLASLRADAGLPEEPALDCAGAGERCVARPPLVVDSVERGRGVGNSAQRAARAEAGTAEVGAGRSPRRVGNLAAPAPLSPPATLSTATPQRTERPNQQNPAGSQSAERSTMDAEP